MRFRERRSDLKMKGIIKNGKRKGLSFLWKLFLCLLETTVQLIRACVDFFGGDLLNEEDVGPHHHRLCPSVSLELTYSSNPHAQEHSPPRMEQMPLHAQWEVGRRSMFCIQRVCVGLNTVHTPQQCPRGRKHGSWNPREERMMVQWVLFFFFLKEHFFLCEALQMNFWPGFMSSVN